MCLCSLRGVISGPETLRTLAEVGVPLVWGLGEPHAECEGAESWDHTGCSRGSRRESSFLQVTARREKPCRPGVSCPPVH